MKSGEEMGEKKPQRSILASFKEHIAAFYRVFSLYAPFTIGTPCIFGTPFLFYYIFMSKFWWIGLMYLFWYIYDIRTPFNGGYRIQLPRHLPFFKVISKYFSAQLVKTVDLNPEKTYIFAFHPHGFMSYNFQSNFMHAYSNAKLLFPDHKRVYATVNMFFYVPILRELQIGCGAISANRESVEYFLNNYDKGNMMILYVGGQAENVYSYPGKYHLILKKRKGFIKVALKTGTSIVPVIGFGENDIYDRIESYPGTRMHKIATWIQERTGYFPNLIANFVPKKIPLTTVVGRPIDIPKITEPTVEDIEQYHKMYIEELIKLFNEHKSKYVEDPENTEIIFAKPIILSFSPLYIR